MNNINLNFIWTGNYQLILILNILIKTFIPRLMTYVYTCLNHQKYKYKLLVDKLVLTTYLRQYRSHYNELMIFPSIF